jgi:hypothetical protein
VKCTSGRNSCKPLCDAVDELENDGQQRALQSQYRKQSYRNNEHLHPASALKPCSASNTPQSVRRFPELGKFDDPSYVETPATLLHPLARDLLYFRPEEEEALAASYVAQYRDKAEGNVQRPNHIKVQGARRLRSKCPWRRGGANEAYITRIIQQPLEFPLSNTQSLAEPTQLASSLADEEANYTQQCATHPKPPEQETILSTTFRQEPDREYMKLDGLAPLKAMDLEDSAEIDSFETTSHESSGSQPDDSKQLGERERKRRRRSQTVFPSSANGSADDCSSNRRHRYEAFDIECLKADLQQYLLRFDVTDLMGFNPSVGEVPMTPVYHCSHCGFENRKSKATTKCVRAVFDA